MIALSGCDSVFGLDTVHTRDVLPVFVQANEVAKTSGESPVKTLAISLDAVMQTDLIVVAVCMTPHNNVTGVSDDNQTAYTALPINATLPAQQSNVYYSRVTESRTPFSVSVTFDAEGSYTPDLRVAQYANIAALMAVENAGVQMDPNAASIELMIDVPVVPGVVVASMCVGGTATEVTGFTTRAQTTNGSLLADEIVTTAGPLDVTGAQDQSSGVILQLVAFEGGSPP
jgi:hypothetical protein